jgi:hypothetical protein
MPPLCEDKKQNSGEVDLSSAILISGGIATIGYIFCEATKEQGMFLSGAVVAGFVMSATVAQIPTAFWQVTPEHKLDPTPVVVKPRAVLLIHGLVPRPVAPSKARLPEPNSWQLPNSEIVRELKGDFDIYGLSYAQVTPVEWVCHCEGIQQAVKKLNSAGYQDITLIGHSAGGLISRHFVENYPNSGVTKVISVASPHQGSFWANIPQIGLPSSQIPFIKSLAPGYRSSEKVMKRDFPDSVQFCCVICQLPRLNTDSVVSVDSQWPEDLQKQGIPASVVRLNHFEAVRSSEGAKAIGLLAREKIKRWTPEEVEQARKALKLESAKGEQKSKKTPS